jgi:hypothetical protein
MRSLRRLLAVGVLLVAVTPRGLLAQRELHWDALDVDAAARAGADPQAAAVEEDGRWAPRCLASAAAARTPTTSFNISSDV